MSKIKNITSPIRSGFDYQDLWTLKLCGECLLNPDKYKWIQVEGNPTEDRDFFLEDIILLDEKDRYHFYQAKFKTDSQYEWSWDDFIKRRKGKKGELPSLFNKWSTSFDVVGREKIQRAILITNGAFSDEIKPFLGNNKIDIQKLKTEEPTLYDQIKAEIGNDEFVKEYFDKFEFIYESKKLDEIENEIISNIFLKSLCATIDGVNNLLLQIKREARKSFTIKLTLDQIRAWCEFDTPRPLNEKFEVPSDFQFFDEDSHKRIFQDLQDSKGGIKVILGKPGTGKSVYLSELSEELKGQSIVVIKHHYHINPADSKSFERLNSDRVIEAIKAQFKSRDYSIYLGELAHKNSRQIPLREFIASVADNLFMDGRNFVIIIDGLDHVVREKNIQELKNILDELYYPQKGLWIVFGMQPQVKNESSLQSIFDKISHENWIEIEGLNKDAVFRLLKQNSTDLNLPDEERLFDSLANKVYEITMGNPLHLRYILAQLKNRLGKQLITEYDCKDLIPYGDSIEKYYESLWKTLAEEAKAFLLTLISVDFQFARQQFIECISSFEDSSTTISQNFNKVEHLISSDLRGKLRIYHNSFGVFLYGQEEWEEQRQVIKKKVKQWLEKSEYENLKWAELKKLEYELGNNAPILEINRKWLIDAIVHPRNPSQIGYQLKLSSKAVFDNIDFGKALKLSHLHTYYNNAQDFVKESADLIWTESVKDNPDFIDDLILSEMSSNVLVEIANIAEQKGKFYIIHETIDILRERLTYQEYREGEIPSYTQAIIKIIPLDRTHKTKKLYEYIIQFRDLEISPTLFRFYADKMLSLGHTIKLKELLKLDLTEEERKAILLSCIRHDLKQKTSSFIEFLDAEKSNSCLEHIYLILQNIKISSLPELPDYNSFPSIIPEHGAEREIWTTKYHDFFYAGVIYGLCKNQKEIEEWIKHAPSQWPALATIALFRAALKIADTILKEKTIYCKDVFAEIKNIPTLKWPEDRDKLDFQFALKKAMRNIFKDMALITHFLNGMFTIDKNNYNIITSTPFFLQNDLFEYVLESNQPILVRDVYEIILTERDDALQKTVNNFPERSEDYANLSAFCRLYGEHEKSKELLLKSADNFLGYIYHKDTYLFDVLESIRCCAESGIESSKIDGWIHRIIPLITSVGDYTDGDETNHLPSYLADFLSKYDKRLLLKFYFDEADKEELYPAQELFKYVVRSLSFKIDTETALATTALDKDSLWELKEHKEAKASLDTIQQYLGEIEYKKDDYSSPSDYEEEKPNYAEIAPEKLEEHLGTLKTKWDFDKYVIGWTICWLKKESKGSIYNLIKSIILKNSNIQSASCEILDIIYPLAYEFDNSDAFSFLCSAQVSNHGWDRYWTDKKKAERRWDFIKEKYPQRYLEFFKASTNSHIPLARGVEFFIRFSDLKNAEAITEASIEFAEELMADIKLPYPDWTKSEFQEVDEEDLLFQRLVWPSPLVRERSATAIGNLLANSSKKEEIYNRLLNWIKSWKSESIIAIGLLPIIKSFHVCKNRSDVSFIKIEDILSSIQANSVVIEKLLSEITLQTKEELKETPGYLTSEVLPDSYEPNDFFYKHIRTILAQIYFIRAEEIEEKTRHPFIKLWAYNAEHIAKGDNIEFKSNHYFYGNNKNGKFLTGYSTKVSEVYRSAFLRVMHDFYNNKLIHPDFYLQYAFATLPVNLSLWNILPNPSPAWWPKLIDNEGENAEDKISTIRYKEPIEDIVNYKKDEKIILAAEGAIKTASGALENPTHSFSLIGFGYKVYGPDLPEPEEISKDILYPPQTHLIPSKTERPLSFLENSDHFDIHTDPIKVRDLGIVPLVTRNRDLTIGIWQYFRDYDNALNVVHRLRSGLNVSIKDNRWVYETGNSNEIVIFKDWLEGLQERYEFKMPIPHGIYISMDEKYLTEKLNDSKLKLGYILKTTYRSRKYSDDEIQQMDDYKFINVSKIIIN